MTTEWTPEMRKKKSEWLKSRYASGEFTGFIGKKQSKKWHKAIRKANKGNTQWKHPNCIKNQIKKGDKLSIKTQFKEGMTPWNIGKKVSQISGKRNHRWKGGITPQNNMIRGSLKCRMWRRNVFKRDDYTCQGCGERGGHLNAHHLISFSKSPKYRFEVWNGQTVCKECHTNLHHELGRGGYF